MIGRAHHVVYDCAEPRRLAAFSSTLLGLPVVFESADRVVVAESDRSPSARECCRRPTTSSRTRPGTRSV
jgi:hypothetical protein